MNISRQELLDLYIAKSKLEALERAGVDNWSGYHYAFEDDEGNYIDHERYAQIQVSNLIGSKERRIKIVSLESGMSHSNDYGSNNFKEDFYYAIGDTGTIIKNPNNFGGLYIVRFDYKLKDRPHLVGKDWSVGRNDFEFID